MPFLLLFLLITSFVSAADPYRFEVKTIAEDFARPMGMDLGPDGSIYLIELQGKVNRIHPTTGKRTILAEIEVFRRARKWTSRHRARSQLQAEQPPLPSLFTSRFYRAANQPFYNQKGDSHR